MRNVGTACAVSSLLQLLIFAVFTSGAGVAYIVLAHAQTDKSQMVRFVYTRLIS